MPNAIVANYPEQQINGVDELAKHLGEHGWPWPPLVVLTGHRYVCDHPERLEAARRAGLAEVPAVGLGDVLRDDGLDLARIVEEEGLTLPEDWAEAAGCLSVETMRAYGLDAALGVTS